MAKQVFILEDDQGIRDILALILQDEGYEIRLFSNVKEFNLTGINTDADLYLLDVMLPDGNGMEVCKELKSNPET